MSWQPLAGGIPNGNLTYWRLPTKLRHGELWIYLPGFPSAVSGSVFLGLGDGLTGVPAQVGSSIARLTEFARIFRFDMPRLENPVLGARIELDAGTQPSLLPSFQFFESNNIAWGDSMPWRFSQFEPPVGLLWWETDGNGLPLYEWPWKWNPVVNKWVSSQFFLVSESGSASATKSGVLTDDFPLAATNIFIEGLELKYYLDTAVETVGWTLEVREIDTGFIEQIWDISNLSGPPLRTTRYLSKTLNQLRARPRNGWAWKLLRVSGGGAINFDLRLKIRQVRQSI